MSQSLFLEIYDSTSFCIKETTQRIQMLGEAIEETMSRLQKESIHLGHSNIHTCGNSKETSIQSGNNKDIIINASRIVALVDALSLNKQEIKPLQKAVEKKFPNAEKIRSNLKSIITTGNIKLLKENSSKINSTLNRLNNIVKEKHTILARTEIINTMNIFSKSLSEIGFNKIDRVSIEKGSRKIMRCSNNEKSIYVDVNNNSQIHIDMSGIEDHNECKNTAKKFKASLEKNGLKVSIKHQHFHNKIEGGELACYFNPLVSSKDTKKDRAKRLRNNFLKNKIKVFSH